MYQHNRRRRSRQTRDARRSPERLLRGITVNRGTKAYCRDLLVLALAILAVGFAQAAVIVVPNSLAAVEGNLSMTLGPGQRYQQVFGAPQFSTIPSGGALITQIAFRPDQSIDTPMTVLSSTGVNITLSTTNAAPEALSLFYANNVGANVTTVFNGPLLLTTAGAGPNAGPKAFDAVITLMTPFLYDPAEGNLLLDMIFALTSPSTFRALDAHFSNTDGISRNLGTNPTQGTPNPIAFAVQFTTVPRVAPAPEPATLFLLALGTLVLALIARGARASPVAP
jgi:hypothetical protein